MTLICGISTKALKVAFQVIITCLLLTLPWISSSSSKLLSCESQLKMTDLQISACTERGYVLGAIPQSDFLFLSSSALPRRRSTTLSRRGRSGRSGGPSDHLSAFTETPRCSKGKLPLTRRLAKFPTIGQRERETTE